MSVVWPSATVALRAFDKIVSVCLAVHAPFHISSPTSDALHHLTKFGAYRVGPYRNEEMFHEIKLCEKLDSF
jgi:hypothetical protein